MVKQAGFSSTSCWTGARQLETEAPNENRKLHRNKPGFIKKIEGTCKASDVTETEPANKLFLTDTIATPTALQKRTLDTIAMLRKY